VTNKHSYHFKNPRLFISQNRTLDRENLFIFREEAPGCYICKAGSGSILVVIGHRFSSLVVRLQGDVTSDSDGSLGTAPEG
jgi:hypothetical protein